MSYKRVYAGTDEALNAAGFSDFNFTGLDAFVESDERGFGRRFAVGADDGEEQKIAALNGSEHPVWGIGCFRRSACGGDVTFPVQMPRRMRIETLSRARC